MIISTKRAPICITQILDAGRVPMLHGSPGTAKSSIAKQVAEDRNLEVIDLRLSQCDPTDLSGFPTINEARDRAGYVPMSTFPIAGQELPKGRKGWLLLLDEFNSASQAVQAAAYKLVLDRQVGQFDLHENVDIIAAGNLATDRAIVNRLSTAMQSRLVHLEIELRQNDWLEWAGANGIDHRIMSYIGFKPDILHRFDPDHDDFTFPCARTWEFASDIIKPISKIDEDLTAVISGAVGKGAANEFIAYCNVYTRLPSIDQIKNNPDGITMPDDPSVLWAITGLVAHHCNPDNFGTFMTFIKRMDIEFQVICMRTAYQKNNELEDHADWKKWNIENARELI